MNEPNDLFLEHQSFGKKWWPLLLPSALVPVAITLYHWQQAPALHWFELLPLAGILLAVWGLFFALRLRTRITQEGIYVQFWPFHWKALFFPWEKIEKAYVRSYSPMGEYGGWGLRYGFSKGKAYNVWGCKGLQLEFSDGKKLLIGTQRPEELENTLQEAGRNYTLP